jgi:hypothetical protein
MLWMEQCRLNGYAITLDAAHVVKIRGSGSAQRGRIGNDCLGFSRDRFEVKDDLNWERVIQKERCFLFKYF